MASLPRVELSLFLHHRTENAVLLSETGNRAAAFWLPLSQVAFETSANGLRGDGAVTVTMTERTAYEKGLI